MIPYNLLPYDMLGTLEWVSRQHHPLEVVQQPESTRRMEAALSMTVYWPLAGEEIEMDFRKQPD